MLISLFKLYFLAAYSNGTQPETFLFSFGETTPCLITPIVSFGTEAFFPHNVCENIEVFENFTLLFRPDGLSVAKKKVIKLYTL